MRQLSYEKMLAAMRKHDAAYDGKFYVGVRTMKIYCLPYDDTSNLNSSPRLWHSIEDYDWHMQKK
ncbi:MAG: Ada metal-binding domain-containing protein [bacterium]